MLAMRSAWSSGVLRRVALVVAGVSGGRVASIVGVAGDGVGGCWWLLAWFRARRFWSPWWVGAVRSSGALVLAGAARHPEDAVLLCYISFRIL
jgi:hypothetical protein